MSERPYKQVRKEVEELYLQIAKIRLGTICIYPELARDLDKIQAQTQQLFNKTLVIDPDILT